MILLYLLQTGILKKEINNAKRKIVYGIIQNSSKKPVDSAVVHSNKSKDQYLAFADKDWCHLPVRRTTYLYDLIYG